MWLAPFRANAAPVRGASRIRIRACSAGAAFTPNFPAPWPRPKEGRKKALIVVSHPNVGKSFNHSLVAAGKRALEGEGHAVIVVDLVKIGFNPVGTEKDFVPGTLKNPDSFDYQSEQGHAAETGQFAPDLKEQLDLVDWCDIVIHQFPIYWWSVPAIHKGWIDRCLVWHHSYPPHKSKWVGKQWMLSTTVGPPTKLVSHPGPLTNPGAGIPYQSLLSPLGLGTPKLCGMDPVPLFMVGHATATPEEKQEMCEEFANHLRKVVNPVTKEEQERWYEPAVPEPKWSVSICFEKTIPPKDRPTRPEENLGIMYGEGATAFQSE
uniref:Flavodoxin-like fold domain-containing protein n=1 Tax=Zooxanthella nutricula TaxID=1333877 RepID=A0A6U9G5I6_9DINO